MSCFHRLSYPALLNLAQALESGRLTIPCHCLELIPYVSSEMVQDLVNELDNLHLAGMTVSHIAYWLRLLAQERILAQKISDTMDFVWTGEEFQGMESRDTAVVVKELFNMAKSSILLATYAIDRGKKAQELFQDLAYRLDRDSVLQMRMFINVQRPYKNEESAIRLLKNFAQNFRSEIWPGHRLPEVFYYPPALSNVPGPKACLHAKCVVIDEEQVFITSANFTEAAHQRNIEAGVLIKNRFAAQGVRNQFEMLVSREIFKRIPGL